MRNLRELSRNPYPYILPVIPRSFPTEIVEGEHYIIANLQNLALGSSSPTQTFETEVVGRELVISLRLEQSFLAREDSGPAPQASKKVDTVSCLECLPFTKKGFPSCPPSIQEGKAGA